MSIDSLSSSSVRALDTARTARDKSREVKVVQQSNSQNDSAQVPIIRVGDDSSKQKAETFRADSLSTNTNSMTGKEAIAAYQSVEREQQRQNIQLLLGVDTFV